MCYYLIVVISPCIGISDHHIVLLKYIQFLFVNYTLITLGKNLKSEKDIVSKWNHFSLSIRKHYTPQLIYSAALTCALKLLTLLLPHWPWADIKAILSPRCNSNAITTVKPFLILPSVLKITGRLLYLLLESFSYLTHPSYKIVLYLRTKQPCFL